MAVDGHAAAIAAIAVVGHAVGDHDGGVRAGPAILVSVAVERLLLLGFGTWLLTLACGA